MLTPLICGAFSHSGDDDSDDHDSTPSCLMSRRSRKNTTKNNPYSSLGLDKFSKLLSELEAKKKQIYSHDISLVRFVCKGPDPDQDCKPVVIKMRQDQEKLVFKQQSFVHRKQEPSTSTAKPRKKQWSTNVLLVIALILLCLAVFGRSGATLIMAFGWYLVPVASKKNLKKDKQVGIEICKTTTGSKSNKDYLRKLSETRKVGRSQELEQKGHTHRKSW